MLAPVWVVGLAVVIAFSALVITGWVTQRDPLTVGAHALRRTLGPPAPPVDSLPPSSGAPRTEDWSHIPLEAPEALPEVAGRGDRPAGLDGVSFVLLLGADNRSAKVTGRTDTMMLVAFRERDGAVAAFSVPRDLWIELPDVGTLHEDGRDHARISSVMRVGEVRVARGQGMALLRETLRLNLGVEVDRYALIDMQGFVAVVDTLGGVEVEVACPIMDCFWLDGPDQPCTMMDVPAGAVTMDGATALAFSRSRHGTGDRDRTRRQQAVMLAFARTLKARARRGGVRAMVRTWTAVEPHLETDLSVEDALYYASFAADLDPAEVGGFAIRHPMTRRHVTEDGKHVMLLDRAAFDAALGELFATELPAVRPRKRCPEPDAALDFRQAGPG